MLGEKTVQATPPVTIVIRHPKERAQKCSILPLKGRPDLLFLEYPPSVVPDLSQYVRLAPEGPHLSAADADAGLLLLDGSWRWTDVMTQQFLEVQPRSLQGFPTAYPRVSKLYTDPPGGLATVEALYVAYRLLGRSVAGLLDHYHWRERFLARLGEIRPDLTT
jgi:pre-rRNA-processing protein TSR3